MSHEPVVIHFDGVEYETTVVPGFLVKPSMTAEDKRAVIAEQIRKAPWKVSEEVQKEYRDQGLIPGPTVFLVYERERFSPFAIRLFSTQDRAQEWIDHRKRQDMKSWNYTVPRHIAEVQVDGDPIKYDDYGD